ncbi:MAG: DUF3618 domain-containing protein [Desulforhopalus sp.]
MNEKSTDTGYQDTQDVRDVGKNMNSADYEREIEHTREEINETLHSLEEKLSPRELWNQTVDEWGDELKDFSGNFGRAIRDNPVPAVLMGVSMLWLMTGSGPGNRSVSSGGMSRRTDRFKDKYYGTKDRSGEKVNEIKGKMKSTYQGVKAKATESMGDVSDKIKDVSEDIDHYGEQFRQRKRGMKRRMRTTGSDVANRPILLAAAGLALGSLAALSIPMSRKEEELLGPKGSDIRKKAEEMGREQLEKGKKAAAAAGEAARKEMAQEEQRSRDH